MLLAAAAVAYVLALIFMDETASDIANAAMLAAIVVLLFRIEARLVGTLTGKEKEQAPKEEA